MECEKRQWNNVSECKYLARYQLIHLNTVLDRRVQINKNEIIYQS